MTTPYDVDAEADRLTDKLSPFGRMSDSIAQCRIEEAMRAAFKAGGAAAERWMIEVAEGLGFLNRPEGQGGYEVAEPAVIIAAWRDIEKKAEQHYEGALKLAQDRAEAAEADRDEYDRQRKLYHADMMSVREQRDAALAELAKLRDARVERSKEWWMEKARAEADTPIAAGVPDDSRCLDPFPPGALKPEWEGDPAHAQTVAATDKQIDGFNESADPVEWVVYFTNPRTGARAQMFAVLRPYPEIQHPAPAPRDEGPPDVDLDSIGFGGEVRCCADDSCPKCGGGGWVRSRCGSVYPGPTLSPPPVCDRPSGHRGNHRKASGESWAPRDEGPRDPCCHREGHVGGVLHICNRATGHEPPCIMELFPSSEPRDPPGLRIGATQTVGRTADGRVSVDVLTISVTPDSGGPTNG